MKILHCTDPHISGRNPIVRTDNLVDVQFDKLDEVISISNQLKIPVVITGDIFEQPNVSYSISGDLAEILRKSLHGVYIVVGNHDLMWYNMSSLKSTALGALLRSVNTVKHISEFSSDYSLKIDFCDWGQSIDKNQSNILITHKAVVPNKFRSFIWDKHKVNPNFWFESDVDIRAYDIVLCGHYHKQYGSEDRKIISNPGSLTRRKANDDEMGHMPTINLVDTTERTVKLIKLSCASEASKVFNQEHIEHLQFGKEEKEQLHEFLNQLSSKLKKKKIVGSNLLDVLLKMINSDEIGQAQKEILQTSLQELFGNKINIHKHEENFTYDKYIDGHDIDTQHKKNLRKKLK